MLFPTCPESYADSRGRRSLQLSKYIAPCQDMCYTLSRKAVGDMKNKKKKGVGWGMPEDAAKYFSPYNDDAFKVAHPVLYWLTILIILVLVVIGPCVYLVLCGKIQPQFNHRSAIVNFIELIVMLIGFVFSFGISIGSCNLFLILHKQYLGHWVTLISFAIGIVGSALFLLLLWII